MPANEIAIMLKYSVVRRPIVSGSPKLLRSLSTEARSNATLSVSPGFESHPSEAATVTLKPTHPEE